MLPALLHDYYTTLGKHSQLNHTQDQLITPKKYPYFVHPDYFIFYAENQTCCLWAIAKKDLCLPNPKVYVSYDQQEWQEECASLSEFLLAMAHLQAVFSLPYAYEGFKEIDSEELEAIQTHFAQKPFKLTHWLQGATFYGGATDSIVVMNGGDQLTYASLSETSFEKMHGFLKDIGEEM